MKRVLFFVFALIILSCQDKPKKENCQPSIIIDKTLLGAGYSNWRQQHDSLVCYVQNNDIFVDLSKIKSDPTNAQKATWLAANGNFVNYSKSKTLTLSSHVIPSQEIDSVYNDTVVSVGQIKNTLTPAIYNNDKYTHYLYVTFSPTFSMSKGGFRTGGGSYSVPFLRAVFDGLSDNSNIQFIDAEVTENGSQVRVLIIRKGNTYYNYSKWPTKK